MNKTNQLIRICHHGGQLFYGKINALSDHNISRLNEAKTKRQELGGDHLHLVESDPTASR